MNAVTDLAHCWHPAYRKVGPVQIEPLSIFFQQAGEALERLYGKPIAGKRLDHLYNDWFRKRAFEGDALMVRARCPIYERRMVSTILRKIGYHKLYLPFGDDRVTHALSYIIPSEEAIKNPADWEPLVKSTLWLEVWPDSRVRRSYGRALLRQTRFPLKRRILQTR